MLKSKAITIKTTKQKPTNITNNKTTTTKATITKTKQEQK